MYRTIKEVLYLENIARKSELEELFKNYQSDSNYIYSRFSGIKSLNILDFRTIRQILKEEKDSGKLINIKLQGHYFQRCLNSAIGNIKTSWCITIKKVRKKIQNKNLTDIEKHFSMIILKNQNILYQVLVENPSYENLIYLKEFNKYKKLYSNCKIRYKYIKSIISRYVRKYKPTISRKKHPDSLKVNNALYSFNSNNKFKIQGLLRGKRIEFSRSSDKLYKSEATLKINKKQQIEIHFLKKVKNKISENNNIIGIDKGYTDLFHSSTDSNNKYGIGFRSKIINKINKDSLKQSNRNYYWSLYYKSMKSNNICKANNILKHNLGYIKRNNFMYKFKKYKKSLINNAINLMLQKEKPGIIVVEDLSWVSKSNKYINKKLRNELSKWDKGYIKERLEFKCYEKGIKIVEVNPAYTSQICHKCNKIGNRNGEVFSCDECGSYDANYNAAINIKNRINYKNITKYTSYIKVKQIFS